MAVARFQQKLEGCPDQAFAVVGAQVKIRGERRRYAHLVSGGGARDVKRDREVVPAQWRDLDPFDH